MGMCESPRSAIMVSRQLLQAEEMSFSDINDLVAQIPQHNVASFFGVLKDNHSSQEIISAVEMALNQQGKINIINAENTELAT